ncbi:MAG: helix-turn-helix domain-containing protein [Gemmatimonadota bacterium]
METDRTGAERAAAFAGDVTEDVDFAHEQPANIKLRWELMISMRAIIEELELRPDEAAALFGTNERRIADVVEGKIDLFTIDTLVNMLAHAGVRVELRSSPSSTGTS